MGEKYRAGDPHRSLASLYRLLTREQDVKPKSRPSEPSISHPLCYTVLAFVITSLLFLLKLIELNALSSRLKISLSSNF
jgi:hypothetical protein